MAPQTFQLVVRTGPTAGTTYELSKSEITIGRESTNDIVISDAEVSRRHARLLLQPGGYMLEDLGSTNGTFVNGQRLMGPHSLQPGELIVFGENLSLSYDTARFDPDATIVGAPRPAIQVPERPGELQGRASSWPAGEPEPYEGEQEPVEPPYRPVVPPPPRLEVPPGPGDIPSGPEVYDAPPRRLRPAQNWILAGCGCLTLSICGIAGFAYLLDQLNMLCTPALRPAVSLMLIVLNPLFGTSYYCP